MTGAAGWADLRACVRVTVVLGRAALTVVFGPALIFSWLLVVAVGWARVQLREHDVGQVVAGAVVGAVATGLLYPHLAGISLG